MYPLEANRLAKVGALWENNILSYELSKDLRHIFSCFWWQPSFLIVLMEICPFRYFSSNEIQIVLQIRRGGKSSIIDELDNCNFKAAKLDSSSVLLIQHN